jgi:hypothetical protein
MTLENINRCGSDFGVLVGTDISDFLRAVSRALERCLDPTQVLLERDSTLHRDKKAGSLS